MKTWGLASILFFFTLTISLAQKSSLDISLQELTKEIKQYERDYKTLAVHRGQSYLEGEFTAEKLRFAIRNYSYDLFGDNIKEFRFLFYHFHNDSMNIWLFDSEGKLAASQRRPLSPDSLLILESTVKFRLDVEHQLAQARGKEYSTGQKKYRLTQPQAVVQLTNILLPQAIAEKLAGTKYLLILPCLNISSLPYSMLTPWGNGSTVIDSLSYSFSHNLKEFFDMADPEKGKSPYKLIDPVIVGNPTFKDSCTTGLDNLPGAEMEAREVAKQLGVDAFVGDHAVKDDVVKRMKSSTFIYLATHGYSDPENAMQESFLAFADPGGCGFLPPSQIQRLNLPDNALVILSACETGNGQILDAGVIGIARGFLKANARSVVMSLWKVDDEQTRKLMLIFVDELKKPHCFFPAENFRQAVLRYKKEINSDPLYWAAFQNFGTPLSLMFENNIKRSAIPER